METIKYPSAMFPGPSRITLQLPEGWQGVAVPSTLIAAERTVPPGEFISNVIVRSQRVGPGVTLRRAAEIADEGIDGLTDVEDIGRWLVKSDSLEGYAREFAYRDATAGTLAQAWRVFVVNYQTVTDLIEVVGSVVPSRSDDFSEVRAILDSVQIEVDVALSEV